jgi:ABC-type nitrate/sulfonate/bicarbonate transport system substrate-binding protein
MLQFPPAPLNSRRRRVVGAMGLASVALAAGGCASPVPTTPTKLRVKVFPGAQNLPLYAAVEQGYFAKRGLDVELLFTLNSVELREGLASGEMNIVHSAVDNAVAMREVAGKDIVVFIGGDGSLNEFFVQPDIQSVEQMRGKTLIVDAPDTAYALQAYEIMRKHGLSRGDYQIKIVGGTFARIGAMLADRSNTASMLNPPFSLQARDAGLRSLGGVPELIGPYQASAGFTMRAWAASNGEVLERYITAYVESVRWSTDRANKPRAVALLAEKLKLAPPLAERTYEAIVDPTRGLARDARLDDAGFANVLRLRGELEPKGLTLPLRPERYVDMSWYNAAVKRLGSA